MLVREIMQSKVVSTGPQTAVERAYEIMQHGGFRHLPILDDQGDLIGIVSERDLLGVGVLHHDRETGAAKLVTAPRVTVATVMVTEPITVTSDTSVMRAARIIRDRRIGCLVVCDAGRMVGIMSYLDILGGAEAMQREPAPARAGLEDTQPIDLEEILALKQQLAEELRHFEVEGPPAPESSAQKSARARLSSRRDSTGRRDGEADAEAAQRVIADVAAQLKSDDR